MTKIPQCREAEFTPRDLRACRAFTLIELLVVIAIIAVLVAIASPILATGKRAGLEAKSVSRLRDLQMANIQYAGEHNQFYVPIWDMNPSNSHAWFDNPEFEKYFVANTGSYWWGNSPENMYSPLVPLKFSQSIGSSYGINADYMNWPPAPRQMLRDVPFPARMLAFEESQDWIVTEYGAHGQYKVPEAYSGSTTAYRYNNMTNIVFFDGHVETLPQSKVAGNTTLWRGQDQ
ncbi:MAG TPA: type II secretion system protein [Bryobacteraceae bacterium]|nr:type II secretion system protein [Bryobacteraceae bacterium]